MSDWRAILDDAIGATAVARDWSLGFTTREWMVLTPDRLPTDKKRARESMNAQSVRGVFDRTVTSNGTYLFRLADERWEEMWPAMVEQLKGNQ